ncbi:MAG: hypothetical protein IKQ58_05535 [Prevotella sp.]|nr:hypothetical protein [Prevotella sp.]
MKKFVTKIILLFAIIAILDCLIGIVMSYVVNHIQVGGQGRDNYICNKAEEDILIFGSSRAVHHYNATMLEDSTGLSCYNCGDDSNGIILSYGRLMMAKERHQPKIIIQDVEPTYDLFKNDNHKYLGWLKARYERNGIPNIFDEIDKTEQYKMLCQSYKYNSKFLQNLFVYFTSIATDTGIKGFRPINAAFDPMKISRDTKPEIFEFDPLKIDFINKFIELSKGAQLVFVVSPMWYGMDTLKVDPLRNICKQHGITLLDFSNDSKYVHNNDYFNDGIHLNARGADEFTKDLIKELRKRRILE